MKTLKKSLLFLLLFLIVVSSSIFQTIPGYGITKAEPFMSPPVILPTELFKCRIEQMRVGDIGYWGPSAMITDVEGQAYLWGFIELEKGDKNLEDGWLQIEKKTDGYHVTLMLGKQVWDNGRPYYWKPYTVSVNFEPARIVSLKGYVQSGAMFSVKKITLIRDRGWFRKYQIDTYEGKLPNEIRKGR